MRRKSRSNKNRSSRYSKRVQRYYQYKPNISDVLHPLNKELFHVEDRRRFRPQKSIRKNLSIDGEHARTTYNDVHRGQTPQNPFRDIPRYVNPRRTIVCRRRSIRRRSLFALVKIGKGKGSTKRRRFTEDSKISCK